MGWGVGWVAPRAAGWTGGTAPEMGLGAAATRHAGGMLWLAVTPCFLGLPPPLAEAQATTSGAEDAGVLREAKAAADTSAC
eukprot:COSAG04_NODE_2154_length_4676_cov_9.156859_1_plen_80_part_10